MALMKPATIMAALTLMLVLVATPLPASAHAPYKNSMPAKGEILAASPPQVVITFTEDVQKISGTYGIDVTNAAGASVISGPSVLNEQDRSQMSVPLNASLAPGRYVARWKNVSDEDGDPAEGAFSFYVATQPTAADLAADADLAAIDGEVETPAEVATVRADTPVSLPTIPGSQSGGSEDDDSGVRLVVYILAGAGVAVLALAVVGATWIARRRS